MNKIDILKQFMHQHNFNIVQTAKSLCVTEGAVRFWVKGKREIPNTVIELIKYKNKE